MNLLRQNTDYALRMMSYLAGHQNQSAVSVRVLAAEEDVSYQFACKILQKLNGAKLVESVMGPKGGYRLSRGPEEITMLEVIRTMQGKLAVNCCTDGAQSCPRQPNCPVSKKLWQLQYHIEDFLAGVSLKDLLEG